MRGRIDDEIDQHLRSAARESLAVLERLVDVDVELFVLHGRLAERSRDDSSRATSRTRAIDGAATQSRGDGTIANREMEVLVLQPNNNRHGSRRIWSTLVAIAACTILIAVGVVALTRDGGGADVATGDTQHAVDIAQRFIAARDASDLETIQSLLAEDAVSDEFGGPVEGYAGLLRWERVVGWRFMESKCTAIVVGPPAEVTCTYTMENRWSRALGLGPFAGSSFQLVIADGQIQHVTNNFDSSLYSIQVFDEFIGWVEAKHPGDTGMLNSDRTSPEGLARWEERTVEFEAVRTAITFIEARDAWDGEMVRALVADDAVIHDSGAGVDDYVANSEFERATGWRFMLPGCDATVVGPQAHVDCIYWMENGWSQALGVAPFTDSWIEFVIADGQITRVTNHYDNSRYYPQVLQVFVEWVDANHPGDVETMFDTSGGGFGRRFTPEAIALVEQRTTEFVASLTNPASG